MSLSKDLISQFVKATKDATTVKKESTVYGTVVKYNDKTYVKIDGSDLLTPAETLSSVEEGERVSIMIKDHTATITGNYTAPSASSIKVDGMDADLKANTANIKNLIAKNAEIENLVAGKANIEDLTAANAEIGTLKANYAEIETLVADKASIGDLEAVNADIKSLKADKADIAHLEANYATIGSLNAVYADITRLEADKANIEDLTAINANIKVLTVDVADIKTLVSGNLTSDNIQSLNLTSANTTIENAMIKNAMIESISANKINAGIINTNNISIQSDDGGMLLQGTLQQFKDENGNVRIQIGKDTTGNFTFVLYDENGVGQLINQNGIQSSNAIADGLIVDAKVAENANISGGKLDIDSVITEINDGTTTIKGTRIYLDDKGQTLDLAFNSLSTTVDNLKVASGDVGDLVEKVTTNTTNIQIAQGQIATLITNTTITKENGEVIQLKDAYNSTVDTVDSHSTKIGSLETNYSSADNRITSVESKQTELEQTIDGFKQTVSKTYTTKDDYNDLADDLHTNYSTTETMNSAIEQKANSILSTVSSTYVTTDEMTGEVTNINNSISEVRQEANKISWLIQSGDSSSNMALTDNALSVIANNINLTGKVSFSCLDSSTQNTINTANSNASSAKSILDNNSSYWTNAYNRVVDWAYGSVGDTTTINGGLIQTGTITAKHIYLGDLTNYCNLRKETASLYGFTSESSSWGTWYKLNNNKRDICISGNKVNDYGYYKCSGGESFRIKFEVKSNVKGSSTKEGSDSVYCGVKIGLYGKLGDGNNFHQVPSSGYTGDANSTEGHINVWTTLPSNARSFGVFLQLSGWGNWSGTCRIKNVQVFRMSSGELIVDGAVTADKIAANAVTADKIAANAVTADKIEANAVTADKIAANAITSNKLSADAITGKTITGGIINGTEINGSTINSDSFVGDVLAIDGIISAKSLQVQDIDSAKYPATLDGNVNLYVNSSSGNDDIEVDDDARFKTLQGAIDAIPKFLNNKTVYITMETDSTEDVSMRGIVGGAIRIYMNGKTLYGTLKSYVCAASITVYGGTKDSTEGATGVIHPNVGLSFGSRAVSVGFEASQYAAMYKIKVFAPDNIPSDITNKDKVCVASQSGTGSVYCKNIQIVNAVIGFRSNNVGAMHVNSSSGVASKYGFQATTGGIITIANNAQAGGKTGSTNKSAGGQVIYDANGPTFATGNQSTDGGTAPVAPTTKTITIKSSYGDTYRSSVYNNWKKDGTVRQGDYGYGDCNGCWFFGSAFAEVKGATIKKVTITITRQSGGSSSAVGLVVKSHGYSSRPSGKPSYRTTAGTLSLAAGKSDTLTITNSTILSEIKSGAVKGFGIQTTYDSSHYAVCSGSVTVKIEYQE